MSAGAGPTCPVPAGPGNPTSEVPVNPFDYAPGQQAKAFVAAAIAAAGALQASLPEGVTANEWIGVVLAGLVGYGAVFGVPNRPSI